MVNFVNGQYKTKMIRLRHNGLVTRIYKSEVYLNDDGIMTTDVVKLTKFNNGNIAFSAFNTIRLEN